MLNIVKLKNKVFQSPRWLVVSILAVLILGVYFVFKSTGEPERKPLYWVAPMDPNYRRDSPGQSPMGMDLVPVYAEDKDAQGKGEGVVSIRAEVQNLMGVKTAVASYGVLEQHLTTYGRVVFDQTQVHRISPRVTGWVDMLFVATEGEAVRQGQPLFALYSPELIEAQEAYLKALDSGRSMDIAKTKGALKALNMDEKAIRLLQQEGVAQQSVVFSAPIDGVVGMLKVTEDQYLEPGDLVMAIGSLESVWVELKIFASQVSQIRRRQLLTFSTPSYPGTTWDAEVDYIYPALNSVDRNLLFRAIVDNPGMRLKPNMHVQGLMRLPDRPEAVLIPRQAVISVGEQDRVVLDLGEGRFKSVAVTLGESNSRQIEVIDGLEDGDRVVTSAQFLIDSESSKTSDFLRMQAVADSGPEYPPTWVNATVKEVDLTARKLRLNHEYIDDWKMPSMTMNFQVVDQLSLKGIEVGQKVQVKVADGDPLFQVLDIKTHTATEPK